MNANQKKILILSANPKDTARLRLDAEVREICERVKFSKNREQFVIQQVWAVRLRDLRRAMLEYEPHIVHFCGHGEENGIIIEDENGESIIVDTDALAGLFELFKDQTECVLLNACYSQLQAEAINKHINYVIGINTSIQDKAAIEFAIGFYDALAAGRPIEEAFRFGCNAIQLYNIPQYLSPILKKNVSGQSKIQENSNSRHNDALTEQYQWLSEQLHRLKMDKIIETDTLTRFKLEKQIEQIEEELHKLEMKRS
jgi:hypothetical protein